MLDKKRVILASQSPRRQELLKKLDIDFDTTTIEIDEKYPEELQKEEIAEFIAIKKADKCCDLITDNTILITADTVVILENSVFGKPIDLENAKNMLKTLSGKSHKVITGVCVRSKERRVSFSAKTEVFFSHLTDKEIDYYISNYKVLDKAGAYGIQDWIGCVGIEKIEGSFYNVMGLPVQKLHQVLKEFFN